MIPEAARPKTRPSGTPRDASINADRHNIWYGRRSLLLNSAVGQSPGCAIRWSGLLSVFRQLPENNRFKYLYVFFKKIRDITAAGRLNSQHRALLEG